jgi:hypothetical protein
MAGYVQELTSKVIGYDLANKTFQGQTLLSTGQLVAGQSTGLQLTELYEKWFLGQDLPTATDDYGDTFTYTTASGSLFGSGGPSYQDIDQGVLGDCYFLGALGEIADRDPQAIKNMFLDNGDGTWTVVFYETNGKADYVTVNNQLPVYQGMLVYDGYGNMANSSTNVLWAELAEKAYAQLAASGWSRAGLATPANSYMAIEGGYGWQAMQQVMGESTSYSSTSTSNLSTLLKDVQAGMLVTLGSKQAEPRNSPVFADHEYYITGYDPTTKTYTVVNPWGWNYTQNGKNYGTLHLTASQIQQYFSEFDVGASSATHGAWS